MSRARYLWSALACIVCSACGNSEPARPEAVPETAIFHRPGPAFFDHPAHWMDCSGDSDALSCEVWSERGGLEEWGVYRLRQDDGWCPHNLVERTQLVFRAGHYLLPVSVQDSNGRVHGSATSREDVSEMIRSVSKQHFGLNVGDILFEPHSGDAERIEIQRADRGEPLSGWLHCGQVFRISPADAD